MDKEKLFSWIDSKVVYSLSFLLIIVTLKDSILSFFPSEISFEFFGGMISPSKLIDVVISVLFMSIYFYGVNYVIKDPLSKVKKYANVIASSLWTISFVSPFYILIILFFHSLLLEGFALMIISTLFVLFGVVTSIWSAKQERESDSMELEQEIEKLKLGPTNENKVAEFLRYSLILESLIKDAIIDKINISIEEDESINLNEATNMLIEKRFIQPQMREKIRKLKELRNKVIHEEYAVNEKDIKELKDVIKEFDLDIKTRDKK
jgi:uncharacterized protein YutE (UPF0331/DUF86 family)